MLKNIAKKLREEIKMAREYCYGICVVKAKSPATAELYSALAAEELDHARRLIKEGDRIIQEEDASRNMNNDHEHSEHEYDSEKHAHMWAWEKEFAQEEIADISSRIAAHKSMR